MQIFRSETLTIFPTIFWFLFAVNFTAIYLELSKILLYYHNIDGEQRRGSPVYLFTEIALFTKNEHVKKSEQKFGKSKNFAYLCTNEMR